MPTSVKKIGPLPAFQTPGKSVEETLVNAPNTTIINRAKVSNSLKPIMGNERIHCNSLNLLANEFGPNGEPVYEPDNGDARVRFVGTARTTFGQTGQFPGIQTTFFGGGFVDEYYSIKGSVRSNARIFSISKSNTEGPWKHQARVATFTTSSVAEDNDFTFEATGKLEKDVFKD